MASETLARVTVARDETGLGHREAAALIKRAVAAALRSEGIDIPCRVDVLLTGDETIRELNREHRGIDRATDVLSFPQNDLTPGGFDPDICERDLDADEILLGDMALSIPHCEAQGEEYGHGFAREVSYLAVHSTLHLLGYDHMEEGDRRLMREREELAMALLPTLKK